MKVTPITRTCGQVTWDGASSTPRGSSLGRGSMEYQTHKGFRMISYDHSHPLWAAGSSSPFHLPGFLGENHVEVHAHSAPGNRHALCVLFFLIN